MCLKIIVNIHIPGNEKTRSSNALERVTKKQRIKVYKNALQKHYNFFIIIC